MEFCIAVEFQFVEFSQVSRFSAGIPPITGMTSALVALTRHNRYCAPARQGCCFKPAFQLRTNITQTITTDAGISNKPHQALETFFQNTPVHKQFAKEVNQFVQLL